MPIHLWSFLLGMVAFWLVGKVLNRKPAGA